MSYESFISNKRAVMPPSGFAVDRDALHSSLFDLQRVLVRLAAQSKDWVVTHGTADFTR